MLTVAPASFERRGPALGFEAVSGGGEASTLVLLWHLPIKRQHFHPFIWKQLFINLLLLARIPALRETEISSSYFVLQACCSASVYLQGHPGEPAFSVLSLGRFQGGLAGDALFRPMSCY